ncbi:hypothetical protein COOONC_15681 [Cooperia oncophora]
MSANNPNSPHKGYSACAYPPPPYPPPPVPPYPFYVHPPSQSALPPSYYPFPPPPLYPFPPYAMPPYPVPYPCNCYPAPLPFHSEPQPTPSPTCQSPPPRFASPVPARLKCSLGSTGALPEPPPRKQFFGERQPSKNGKKEWMIIMRIPGPLTAYNFLPSVAEKVPIGVWLSKALARAER